MDVMEIKCGSCKTIFPLNLEAYRSRCAHSSKISCPSCLANPPYFVSEFVNELLANKDKTNDWEIGLKFCNHKRE